MQDILEKVKAIEDSSHYDIGSQMSLDATHSNAYANQSMVKSSKQMIGAVPRGAVRQIMTNRQMPQPIQNTSSNTCKIPETSGKQPSKEGELKCYECGQKGHMCHDLYFSLFTFPLLFYHFSYFPHCFSTISLCLASPGVKN